MRHAVRALQFSVVPMNRILVGLSVGSGLEGADVAVVRADGIGLELSPQVIKAGRVPFPPSACDQMRNAGGKDTSGSSNTHIELSRNIAETAIHAVRTAVVQAGVSSRDVFAIGFLDPARPVYD